MSELSPQTLARLKTFGEALYELRLTQMGPPGLDEDDRAREWAACLVGEAICVLDHTFGLDAAVEMITAMVERNAAYTGPRYKRMRQ